MCLLPTRCRNSLPTVSRRCAPPRRRHTTTAFQREDFSSSAAIGRVSPGCAEELAARGLDGFIVPRADEHQGEYVPPRGQRLAWLTGFTGSAGLAIVLRDRAALFVDGRYTLQAARAGRYRARSKSIT